MFRFPQAKGLTALKQTGVMGAIIKPQAVRMVLDLVDFIFSHRATPLERAALAVAGRTHQHQAMPRHALLAAGAPAQRRRKLQRSPYGSGQLQGAAGLVLHGPASDALWRRRPIHQVRPELVGGDPCMGEAGTCPADTMPRKRIRLQM